MSQIIPVDQEDDLSLVLDCYKDLIESNESLMIPIIGSISEFKLSNKLKIIAFEITESCLSVVSETDVPVVIRTLLLSLTKEVAKSAINTIRYETSKISQSNFAMVLEVISNVIKINVVAVRYFFDAIERSDKLFKLDIYLLLILLNSSKTKESNRAKKLLLQSIQSNAIELKLLKSIFEEDNEGTFLEQSSLLKLCNHFLLSNNISLIDFTYELYILLYINYPKMRIDILNNLFSISYNSFRTLNVSMKDIAHTKDENFKLSDELLQRRRYQTTINVLVTLCEKYTKSVLQHSQLFEDVLTQWSHSIFLNLDTLDPVESKIQLLFVTHNICRCLVNIAKYQPRILSSLMIYIQKQTASGSTDAQISGLIVASHILNHLESQEVPLLLNFLMRMFKNRSIISKLYLLDIFCGEFSHRLPHDIINNFFFEFILDLISQIPLLYNHKEIEEWHIKMGRKVITIYEGVEDSILYSIGTDPNVVFDVLSLGKLLNNNNLIAPNVLPKLLEVFLIFKPKLSTNKDLTYYEDFLKAGFRLPKDFQLYDSGKININEDFVIIYWYHYIVHTISLTICNYFVIYNTLNDSYICNLLIEKYIIAIKSLQSLMNLIEYGKQNIKEGDSMNPKLSLLISHYQNRPKLYPQTVLFFLKNITGTLDQRILIKSFEILYDNVNQFLVLKNSIHSSKSIFHIKNTIGNRNYQDYPLDFIFASNFEAMNQTTLYIREFNTFEDEVDLNNKNLSLVDHLIINQTLQIIISLCDKSSESIKDLKRSASELLTQGKDDEAENKRMERDQTKIVLMYCYLIFGHVICYLKHYPHLFEKIISKLYSDDDNKDSFRNTMEKLFISFEKQWVECEDIYLIVPLLNILFDLTDGTKKVKEVSNFMVLSLKRLYPTNLHTLSKFIPLNILHRFLSPMNTMQTPGIDHIVRYLIRGAYSKMSQNQKLSFITSLVQALSELNTFIDEEYEHITWQMLSNKSILSFCMAIMQLLFDSISQFDVMKLKSPKDDPLLYFYQNIQQFHDTMLIYIYVYCNCKDSVSVHNVDLGFLLKSCSKLLFTLRKKLNSCIEWRSSYSLTYQKGIKEFNTSVEILKYPFSNTLHFTYTLRSLITQIKFPKDRQISKNLSSSIRDLKSIPQLTLEVEQTIDFIIMSRKRHHIPIDNDIVESNVKLQLLNVLIGKSMDLDDDNDHDALELNVINEYVQTLPRANVEKKIRNRILTHLEEDANSDDWELLGDSELEDEEDLELFLSDEESEAHSLDDLLDINPDASDFLIEDREDV